MMTICVPMFVFMLVYFNYKTLVIAKSKKANDIIVLGSVALGKTEKKKRFVNFKSVSTCSLVVVCTFICFCPAIVYILVYVGSEKRRSTDNSFCYLGFGIIPR